MGLFKKKEKERREANLTLYGAGSDLTDFYEKVQSVFGEYVLAMEKVKTNQFQMTLVDNTEINFFITDNPTEMFNQTNGMSNYFSQAPMENTQVKEAALQQIRMFTCIIGITFELTEDNNRTNFIAGSVHELGRQITAFVLYPNMSLYHPEGQLLISIQGETEFEEYYAIMCKEMVIPTQEENEKDQARKARNLEIVNVVPQPKAGGSFATTAYKNFDSPVAVEFIKADAGIDIGGTLIGMHLKHVAVPIRLSINKIGEANILCARTRPKCIGGERAIYDGELM